MKIKRKIVTKSGAAGVAQQAARSASLSESVLWLTAGLTCGYSNCSALSGGVDGQVLQRPRCTELSRRVDPSRRSEPPRRTEQPHRSAPAASASSPVGVRLLGPGVVSPRPDGRRRSPVCHSASLSIGSRFFCNVRLPSSWRKPCSCPSPLSKAP